MLSSPSTPRVCLLSLVLGSAAIGCGGKVLSFEELRDVPNEPTSQLQSVSKPGAYEPAGLKTETPRAATNPAPSPSPSPSPSPDVPAPSPVNPLSQDPVCRRWREDRQDRDEGTWSSESDQTCPTTDISATGRANALKMVNLYRWLAGLSPVDHDMGLDRSAQTCALLMAANQTLSHGPSPAWNCWTEEGSRAAANSNLASAPGVFSVDGYMVDLNNDAHLGHRRWILARPLQTIGLGSVLTSPGQGYSCMWVSPVGEPWTPGTDVSGQDLVMWPPPGKVPAEVIRPAGFQSYWPDLDDVGWSIQSDSIDLRQAQVTMTANGATVPIVVRSLDSNVGSFYAISLVPVGWHSVPNTRYEVDVRGIPNPFRYTVTFLDCGQ